MTTVAWFHCFSGIAGDMALGSLVDAGADVDEVRSQLSRLPVTGWKLDAEPVLRCGIAATHVRVLADEEGVVRTASHITDLVDQSDLPPRVAERALRTFRRLAEAEGRLHRRPPEQVHFHEVGGIDAIVDVVGTCIALELLGVDEVYASPVATGTGMVRAAHGLLPNPPPAVVDLLRDAPLYGTDLPMELTTPTGAALLAANVVRWGPMPAMTLRASGFGAGSREIDGQPNATQVVIGEAAGTAASTVTGAFAGPLAASTAGGQPVVVVEANVDDATGEVLAHTVAALLDAGAHDAWVTPILMKKGRPAHTVSALADTALAEQVAGVLTAETGSLGVRASTFQRWPASRVVRTVDVDGRPVRVKVSPGRIKAEHDDAAAVAAATGRPLREVLAEAESTARTAAHPGPSAPGPPATDAGRGTTSDTGVGGGPGTAPGAAVPGAAPRPPDGPTGGSPDVVPLHDPAPAPHAHPHTHPHEHDHHPHDHPHD